MKFVIEIFCWAIRRLNQPGIRQTTKMSSGRRERRKNFNFPIYDSVRRKQSNMIQYDSVYKRALWSMKLLLITTEYTIREIKLS